MAIYDNVTLNYYFDYLFLRQFDTSCSSEWFELQRAPDMKNYFTLIDLNIMCYTNGTDIDTSIYEKRCICNKSYFGDDCGIPGYIWKTENNAKLLPKIIRRRDVPRRLIYSLPVNHEFDLFEARMAMQAEAVDAFILHESNYTNSVKVKQPQFLQKFQQGWLSQYHDKFIYIFQPTFPEKGITNGQIADSYMRRHLGMGYFIHGYDT